MSADPRNGNDPPQLIDMPLLRWTPRANELTKLAGSSTRPGFSGDGGQANGCDIQLAAGTCYRHTGQRLCLRTLRTVACGESMRKAE